MARFFLWTTGLCALLLVPVAMWLALHVPTGPIPQAMAIWGPIVVLALDALLFFVAFGLWQMTMWERAGIAFILPLLIAMASWAAMMGEVAARLPPGD